MSQKYSWYRRYFCFILLQIHEITGGVGVGGEPGIDIIPGWDASWSYSARDDDR